MPFHSAELWEVRAFWWTVRALRHSDDKLLQRTMLEVADQYMELVQQRAKLERMFAEEDG